MKKKTAYKYKQHEEFPDACYWADKTQEECFAAMCFLVEQYIVWNNLSARMDKTVFEKMNKYKEWEEEKKYGTFSVQKKKLFFHYRCLQRIYMILSCCSTNITRKTKRYS
ncbi:MAG: hypothetical protein HY738_05270 [Bacteroidia bacterium]|nr:hypothetical protein [Bacteroidia bacterium]